MMERDRWMREVLQETGQNPTTDVDLIAHEVTMSVMLIRSAEECVLTLLSTACEALWRRHQLWGSSRLS